MRGFFIISVLLLAGFRSSSDSLSLIHQNQLITTLGRSEVFIPTVSVPVLNIEKYNAFLDQLDKRIGINPVDATIDQYGKIQPGKMGYRLYRQELTERLYSSYFLNGNQTIELPLIPVYPRVDGEMLGNIRSKRIGAFVTKFNPQNQTRSTNIRLALQAINNIVVFPGERFSFNSIVGKRTAAKGYLRAPVIVRGEYAEDIGGGICQVSTTLFNAVDSAGLKIMQRFSHSRKVPYIPPGRDATVSWYGPDFVFKNTYNQPVLIQAKTMGNYLIIKLYSSDVIQYYPKKIPELQ